MHVYIITPPLKCRNYSGGGGGKTARMRSGRQLKETVFEAQAGGCACELGSSYDNTHETREGQARTNPSIERAARHQLLLLAEEPMATGRFWQRERPFLV